VKEHPSPRVYCTFQQHALHTLREKTGQHQHQEQQAFFFMSLGLVVVAVVVAVAVTVVVWLYSKYGSRMRY
jgi:heme/copper-type cytochrome/quinol oxidase subunit 2